MSLSRLARLFRSPLAALLLLVPLLLSGCNLKSGGFIISKPAHLRFVNALVDGGPITVNLNNSGAIVTGLPFEGTTSYLDINAGLQQIQIVANGASTIYDASFLYIDDVRYTFVVYGTSASPVVQLIPDVIVNTPGDGAFILRAMNAAYGSSGVDVYVTAPGVPLDNQSPNFSGLPYGVFTTFQTINAGTYQVRFTVPNSKQVIYDGGTLTFAQREAYEIIAYTKGSATLVNAFALTIDDTGAARVVDSTLAQFKLVHAGPGTGPINGFVDGTIALANIPYLSASSYQTLAAGMRTVTIETVAAPGAVIASAQPSFGSATDASVVLTGTPGATTALVLPDMNLPGTTGSARVRFVNVTSGVGPVDVYVNFALRVANVPVNASSGYGEFAENTYQVTFNVAGTTTLLLNLPAVAVTAGRTYTLYLVGTPGNLAGALLRDG
ncbi:MAG: DUF4397 domain-containing protein [Betaproteobacteria bacterium]